MTRPTSPSTRSRASRYLGDRLNAVHGFSLENGADVGLYPDAAFAVKGSGQEISPVPLPAAEVCFWSTWACWRPEAAQGVTARWRHLKASGSILRLAFPGGGVNEPFAGRPLMLAAVRDSSETVGWLCRKSCPRREVNNVSPGFSALGRCCEGPVRTRWPDVVRLN